ncbi:CBS-domain-containing protein [Trametes versicolor FP-101664 SS1]|uniref:CBS-domain-containing protein n=1 Tax=Trametes versicolor (strain FP-101664) TaxID=717944 RepID=UPI0004621A45|nr:CBS-domain-containing protein [Trametes versicolor FP-101664 SS1]EIW64727.1 CBS-domain-containing protein [Trametes versicolor FP-101664 SS1]
MSATLSPTNSPRVRRKGSTRRPRAASHLPPFTPESHEAALYQIRHYLKGRTSYDTFPVSFRLIVLDSKLEVKKALQCVVSAPLWNSEKSCFAGMFTVSDIIHLIQYFYKCSSYDAAAADVEVFRLESLRDIERTLGVDPPPLLREHPSASLYDASKRLIQTHARRLPLLDNDTETGHEVIVSILTQYRLLKFISINCGKDIQQLHMPLRKLGIGTYVTPQPLPPDGEKPEGYNPFHPIATATMDTPVFDVVHMFSERGISAVPIVDQDGIVVNLYETVDVITLVRLGAYQSLDLTISEALNQRSPDFPGVVICTASDSLGTLMQLIKKRRVHRLVVVEGEKGRLLGIITLSDVLRYIIGDVTIGESYPESSLHTTMSTPAPPEPASSESPAPAEPAASADASPAADPPPEAPPSEEAAAPQEDNAAAEEAPAVPPEEPTPASAE